MLTSFKRKYTVKETSKVMQHEEIATDLYNRDGFIQSRENDLSKASAKAVKKRAAVIQQQISSQMDSSCSQSSDIDLGGKDENQKVLAYRSKSRVQKLLNNTPYGQYAGLAQVDLGSAAKMLDQMTSLSNKRQNNNKKLNELSKPSSVTTACTYAPNEMSATKSVSYSRNGHSSHKKPKKGGTETAFTAMSSTVTPHPQNDKQKKEKKGHNNNENTQLLGKRSSLQIDGKEYYTSLKSKNAKYVAQQLLLRNKKTGETHAFPMYQKPHLPEFMYNAVVTNFDVSKLEIEYDYDTDEEQKNRSKDMLLRELTQAIEFYVQEDPLKLVDNVLLRLRP